VKAAKVDKRKANHHDSDSKSDGTVENGSDEDSDPEEAAIWKVRLMGIVKPVMLTESIQVIKASLPKADEDEDDEDVDDDDDVDDEDSPGDHSIQDSESDEHAFSDTDTDTDTDTGEYEEASSDAEDDNNANCEFDGVGISGVDGSVNPDSLEPRSKLTVYDQAGSDAQVSPALSGGETRKRKGRGDEDERTRKKKLRALPTFASYEDYARMIEDGPEEEL
jgi:ribosome biogenesis protein MAK21